MVSMRLIDHLGNYVAHPDPTTAACNRIAVLVAANQPFYPLILAWAVGGDWMTAAWTFLSTPMFASAPAVARRHSVAGRALLPVAGLFNGIVSAKVFGVASGVEYFLLAVGLIVLLALRDAPRAMAGLLLAIVATALLHSFYGSPIGRFTAEQYAAFRGVNIYSAICLSIFVVWSLGPIRFPALRLRRSGS